MLGRQSVEALGFYGLLTLIVTMGQALLTLGGTIVLSQRGGQPSRHVELVQIRGGLLIAVVGGSGAALAIDLPTGLSPQRLILLLAVTSLWANAQVVQIARLRLGYATAMQTLATLFQLVLLGVALVLVPKLSGAALRDLIYVSYVLPLSAVGLWHLRQTVLRRRETTGAATGGLGAVIASAYVLIAVSLLFESAERVVALTADDALRTLGLYFACYQVASIIRKFPNIVGQAFLPGFGYLRHGQLQADLHISAARMLGIWGFASGTLLGVLAVSLDDRIGGSFASVGATVAVLAVAFGATAAVPLDGSLLTASGGIRRYQVALGMGLLMFLPLAFTQSLLAIGATRAAAMVALSVACLVLMAQVKTARYVELASALVGGLVCVAVSSELGLVVGMAAWAVATTGFVALIRSSIGSTLLTTPFSTQ
ncbi:MAG: hypothetical protein MSC30_15075 [Gaiellaceae bacterium MAG52_C11]|nr:hypothetical protein [Candidatus Gaiellasilicea maunaloa]